jgi:hypothetical protein
MTILVVFSRRLLISVFADTGGRFQYALLNRSAVAICDSKFASDVWGFKCMTGDKFRGEHAHEVERLSKRIAVSPVEKGSLED